MAPDAPLLFEAPITVTQARAVSVRMTLRAPLSNARGTLGQRLVSFVVLTDEEDRRGYGESVALPSGMYIGPSDAATAQDLSTYLARGLNNKTLAVNELDAALPELSDNCYARAAIEAALWHLVAQKHQVPLWQAWGGTRSRITFGSHIPLREDDRNLVSTVTERLRLEPQRLRVKIRPGRDLDVVQAVQSVSDLRLVVDANGSYDPTSAQHLEVLGRLDDLGIDSIEQPFDHRLPDVLQHSAALDARLRAAICLDESIDSLEAANRALDVAACSAMSVKPGRLGGYVRAIEVAEACARSGANAWCGGMYETDIGRAFNLNLMSRQELSSPGDGDPPSELYSKSLTAPAVMPADGVYRLNAKTALGGWDVLPELGC